MARRGGKKHEEHEAGEAWLLPYSDLMTLLLAVFIALFAISQQDSSKAAALARAFQGMMTGGESLLDISSDGSGIVPGIELLAPPLGGGNSYGSAASGGATSTDTSLPAQTAAPRDELTDLQSQLATYFLHEDLQSDVSTVIDERGLVISVKDSILFDAGSSAIKPAVASVLGAIGESVEDMTNHIRIEGHTDDTPINTAVYPSNWELSSARAASVVRFLISHYNIDESRLAVVAYGETRPIADNDTVEGRAQNRRVDIIVLNEQYSNMEESLEAALQNEVTASRDATSSSADSEADTTVAVETGNDETTQTETGTNTP